jgi:BMFP domain-containing protein YqiC
MAGRPAAGTGPQNLRLEVLKELQQLIDSREARDRVDRGPIAETKGKEHWVLHLTLRALEQEQSHVDTLIGSAYANLVSRLEALDDRLARAEERDRTLEEEVRGRLERLGPDLGTQLAKGIEDGTDTVAQRVSAQVLKDLDAKWHPISDSVEAFAQGSRQVTKDVADTYRVATQTRLLLSENARRMTDLGRDLVALEESLKLVVAKTIEEYLAPLEQRVVQLETQLGGPPPAAPAAAEKPTSPATGE